MQKLMFENLDDLLGEKHSRFFSWGYKKVIHFLNDIHLDIEKNEAHCQGVAKYPSDWSKKTEDTELRPHLSTLDGAIFSIQLSVSLLNWKFNIDQNKQCYTWVRKVVMKSGPTAQYDLNNIPVTTKLVSTNKENDSLCGNLSTFKTTVGAMKIELVLDHFITGENNIPGHFVKIDDLVAEMNNTYFGGIYKDSQHDLTDVEIDIKARTLSSKVSVEYLDREHISKGTSWIYLPHFTCIDTFVSCAQQIQALFYELDNIDRKCSNNLWMREIYYENKEPIFRPTGYHSQANIIRTRVLEHSDATWRMAEVECSLKNQKNSFYLRANIAHQLLQQP